MPVALSASSAAEKEQEAACLGFVEGGLIYFFPEGFGDRRPLQNPILAEQEPVLECKFSEGEADDELLPGKERPVEPASQALEGISISAATEQTQRRYPTWRKAWIMLGAGKERVGGFGSERKAASERTRTQ